MQPLLPLHPPFPYLPAFYVPARSPMVVPVLYPVSAPASLLLVLPPPLSWQLFLFPRLRLHFHSDACVVFSAVSSLTARALRLQEEDEDILDKFHIYRCQKPAKLPFCCPPPPPFSGAFQWG